MSRSGYSDDLDNLDLIRWRGYVASSIRGQRGQALLRELRDALKAMPVKALVSSELETPDGEVCALGAVGKARGIRMSEIDPEDYDAVASAFDISTQLAREIEFLNDEGGPWNETPKNRWTRMLKWAESKIADDGKAVKEAS